MSLVGNLEDLGLGEILQIVSLSRKSGSLSLFSRGREGKIVFRHGQVVQACSSTFPRNLGELLARESLVDDCTLQKAVAVQRESEEGERLDSILTGRFQVPAEVIDDAIREHFEKVIYSLFEWSEGTFDFELQDSDDSPDAGLGDPLQCRLARGLNPQFLAIEGSRIIDEMRHRGETAAEGEVEEGETDACCQDLNIDLAFDLLRQEDGHDEQAVVELREVAQAESTEIVVVDDDSAAREMFGGILGSECCSVVPFEKSEDALIYIDTVYRGGKRPVLLVDLIMPRMDGSGILGGLELLELVHTNFRDLRVLVVADYKNTDAERSVRGMGYPFLIKPRKSSLADSDAVRAFGRELLAELNRLSVDEVLPAATGTINLGDELRLEMGDDFAPSPEPVERSTGISLLRGILEELNNPSLGGGIILLVLRFASEFMNRAVIFAVKSREIVGLGQFGIVDASGKADARIRNIRIPLEADSLFRQVVEGRIAVKSRPDGTSWNNYLFEQLGEGIPGEYFLGPIVSEGNVVALLYGDNLPEKSGIGDTDSLEIFLSQAGMAMEKALLRRKLNEKSQEGT